MGLCMIIHDVYVGRSRYGIQAQLNYTIARKYTSNLPLLVILGPILTDCLVLAATQLAILDGISLWQNQQPTTGATPQDTLALLAHCAAQWPGPRLASGTIVTGGFGFGWSPPEVFRSVLTTSLRALRRGSVDNALLYDTKGLLAANRSYYAALGLSAIMEAEVGRFTGEGIVTLKPPQSNVLVTVTRVVTLPEDTGAARELWVTRALTDAAGACNFSSINGTHRVTAEVGGTLHSVDADLAAQSTTQITIAT